jgi:hypothetical protein
MQVRKEASMINPVKQKNLRMNNAKNEEQST